MHDLFVWRASQPFHNNSPETVWSLCLGEREQIDPEVLRGEWRCRKSTTETNWRNKCIETDCKICWLWQKKYIYLYMYMRVFSDQTSLLFCSDPRSFYCLWEQNALKWKLSLTQTFCFIVGHKIHHNIHLLPICSCHDCHLDKKESKLVGKQYGYSSFKKI